MSSHRSAFAPGRVTIIGDHTDYAGGASLPMAIQLGTTAHFTPSSSEVLTVRSDAIAATVELPLESPGHGATPGTLDAMLGGLLDGMAPGERQGGELTLESDLPLGAGLSSSASVLIASALALGIDEDALSLAMRCQRAEAAAGQDVGLLDQLAILEGRAGCALLIDFAAMHWRTTPIDPSAEILIVHSGIQRSLADGAYAQRRAQCAEAASVLGPLGSATLDELDRLADPLLRARARHVISESARVHDCAVALAGGDLAQAGLLMLESHRSLSEDFAVSLPQIDALVEQLAALPGVHGARMSGGGFGGCVVALADRGVELSPDEFDRSWRVQPTKGACRLS